MKIEMQARVLQYYNRKSTKEEMLEMFRELVSSGDIWNLPTSFLDTAATLIEAGLIGSPGTGRGWTREQGH